MNRFDMDEERRHDELVRKLENSIERLSLQELEALYYDMISKGYLSE